MSTIRGAGHQSIGNIYYQKYLTYLPATTLGSNLSELGKQQALEFAKQHSNIRIDAIYSSHLVRAKETADQLAMLHGLSVQIDRDLRERNPQNESIIEAKRRINKTIKRISLHHKNKTIFIFSHDYVMRVFIKNHFLYFKHKLDSIQIKNTGWVKIVRKNNSFNITEFKGVIINE